MLGVVGRVKQTSRFDARGGRKGKTDPQIWCPGCWIATLRSQWREGSVWIALLRSQWREEELLDCRASLAMTGGGVAGLLHFVRNDGEWVAGLLHFVRNDGEWVAGLLHFVRNDGRGGAGLSRFVRNDGRRGLDCFTSFAMTGGGGAGLPRFARNDGGRGIASLKRGGERGRDSDFLFF